MVVDLAPPYEVGGSSLSVLVDGVGVELRIGS